jgi:hypothetical protein
MKYHVFIIVFVLAVLLYFSPNDGQINYRTGTLRYRKCFIPYTYDQMIRFNTEWLSLGMPDEWGTVVKYPLKSSNNTDMMVRSFISGIAIWEKYDHEFAKRMATEVVEYIKETKCNYGLPKHSIYYSGFILDYESGSIRNNIEGLDEILNSESDKEIIGIIKKSINKAKQRSTDAPADFSIKGTAPL